MGQGTRRAGNGKTATTSFPPSHSSEPGVPPAADSASGSSGTLYIVATPIGNLEDITLRALRILREADLIAAEDTRHTRKLLTRFGISRPMTSYFDHNKNVKGGAIVDKLRSGQSVALVTDAGTPCVSDPGYELVRDAVEAGVRVVPVPGVSSVTAALSVSALPVAAFAFEGFLPNRQQKRRDKLAEVAADGRVLVFFESAKRLKATLSDLGEVMGERDIVVARELTKMHEEFLRGRVGEVSASLSDAEPRGEVVLLVAPASPATTAAAVPLEEVLRRFVAEGATVRDAVKAAVAATGISKREVYQAALRLMPANGREA